MAAKSVFSSSQEGAKPRPQYQTSIRLMKPCISQVTTLSTPLEAEIPSYARGGFRAVELWLTKVEAYLQQHTFTYLRQLLESHALVPAAAAGQGGLLLSQGVEREAHWTHFRRRLDTLAELGVPILIVAADFPREAAPDQYHRAAESLRQAAELASDRGVRIALEFQKNSSFCASLDTALALIAESNTPHAGICLDLFHYYTGPSKFEDLAYLSAANLAWVQVCDLSGTPRELASDSDRILPGEGDFQIDPLIDHLGSIGYEGGVSLEVLNPQIWQVSADRVTDLGYQAVRRVLRQWNQDSPEGQEGA